MLDRLIESLFHSDREKVRCGCNDNSTFCRVILFKRTSSMSSIDDRTGNILTTATIFLSALAVLYLARKALLILILSLLFSDLLEPAVALAQRHLHLGEKTRL